MAARPTAPTGCAGRETNAAVLAVLALLVGCAAPEASQSATPPATPVPAVTVTPAPATSETPGASPSARPTPTATPSPAEPTSWRMETFPVTPVHASQPANVRQLLGRPGEVWGAESAADRLVVARPAD